jgi:hypothetical protein
MGFIVHVWRRRAGNLSASTLKTYASSVRSFLRSEGEVAAQLEEVLGTEVASAVAGRVPRWRSVSGPSAMEKAFLTRAAQAQGVSMRREALDVRAVQWVWRQRREDLALRTAVVLLYYLTVRPSELLSTEVWAFDGDYVVLRRHVHAPPGGATAGPWRILIPRQKSGPGRLGLGEERLLMPLPDEMVARGALCPVRCLAEFMQASAARGGGGGEDRPLLRRISDGGNVTPKAVGLLLKRCVRELGGDDARISAYSLRSGAVTAMLAGGASHDALVLQYGASASSVAAYYRRCEASEQAAQMLLADVDAVSAAGERVTPVAKGVGVQRARVSWVPQVEHGVVPSSAPRRERSRAGGPVVARRLGVRRVTRSRAMRVGGVRAGIGGAAVRGGQPWVQPLHQRGRGEHPQLALRAVPTTSARRWGVGSPKSRAVGR